MRPGHKRILVAGIGNIFHGDDAFGVEVVRALAGRHLPEAVQATDFGIRSYDLAFAMLEGYENVVLVDAASRGEAPGALFLLEIDTSGVPNGGPSLGHGMNPQAVLRLVAAMGGFTGRVFLVGCEPETLVSDARGLSAAVAGAVPKAVQIVERLSAQLLAEKGAQEYLNERPTGGG